MICPLHAWGDESIRSHGLDAPVYLLGASVVDTDDEESVRDALRALRPTHGKLHWRDLDHDRRLHVSRTLGNLEAVHLVVSGSPVDLRRQERARALCLERLVWELAGQGVTSLTLEERPRALMQRDLRTMEAFRGRRVVPPTLRVQHGDPSDEVLLWLPDQVLGAAGEFLAGQPAFLAQMGRGTELLRVRFA